MTKKEIAFIKRHTSADKSTSSAIYGYYVTPSGEFISSFQLHPGRLDENDQTRYFDVLRAILSPQIGKKSFNLSFNPKDVRDSEKHHLLMRLLEDQLKDEGTRARLVQVITDTVQTESNYLILMDFETIDLPSKNDAEDADEVFHYFLCAICPVNQSKEELSYMANSKEFHNHSAGWTAGKPISGFMFPAFHDRAKDIYGALYYAKKMDGAQEQLIQALFGLSVEEMPKLQDEQRESFASVMSEALGSDCTIDLVNQVRETIKGLEKTKQQKEPDEPVMLGVKELGGCLQRSGATADQVKHFEAVFEDTFGANTELAPEEVLETKKFSIETDFCSLKVLPEFSNMVDVKVVNGVRYIMIRADAGIVQLNGIPIGDVGAN